MTTNKRSRISRSITIAWVIASLAAGSVAFAKASLFETKCPKCGKQAVLPATKVVTTGGEKVTGGVLQNRVGEFKCSTVKCGKFTQPLEDLFIADQPKAKEVELKPVPKGLSKPVLDGGLPAETPQSLMPLPPMPPYEAPKNPRK